MAPRTPGERRWTREQMLDCIREALDDTPTTSMTDYRNHHSPGCPSVPTILNEFGTWHTAVEAAGITLSRKSSKVQRLYERKPEVFVDAVIDYAIESDANAQHLPDLSWLEFREWAVGRKPGPDWMRRHCGILWNEAKMRAITALDEDWSDE